MPRLSAELFDGLIASSRKNELLAEKLLEMQENEPVLADIFAALMDECENKSVGNPQEAQAGVILGMIYTYMLYNTQMECDELEATIQ